MNYKEISKGIIRAILILTAVSIGLLILNEIKVLISYIIIALVVSLIGRPFVIFFSEKLKLKNTKYVRSRVSQHCNMKLGVT